MDRDSYGGYLICESINNPANAALIAAAPDLLAALRHVVSVLSPGDPPVFSELVNTAKMAILKAEGSPRENL